MAEQTLRTNDTLSHGTGLEPDEIKIDSAALSNQVWLGLSKLGFPLIQNADQLDNLPANSESHYLDLKANDLFCATGGLSNYDEGVNSLSEKKVQAWNNRIGDEFFNAGPNHNLFNGDLKRLQIVLWDAATKKLCHAELVSLARMLQQGTNGFIKPEIKDGLLSKITLGDGKDNDTVLFDGRWQDVKNKLCFHSTSELFQNQTELKQFLKDMDSFEERALKQGLSPQELIKTYEAIDQLLLSKAEHPLNQRERIRLAAQIMHHAADPTDISQGGHNTCMLASLECRMFGRNPGAAAKLVADVALTASYKAPDGTLVKLNHASIYPDKEARQPVQDGVRDHASQLFEVTAGNLYCVKHNAKTGQHLHYEQLSDSPPGDSGERMFDGNAEMKDSKGNPVSAPFLGVGASVILDHAITDLPKEKDVFVTASPFPDDPLVTVVKSPKELNDKLADLKQKGKLPLLLLVFVEHDLFNNDVGGQFSGPCPHGVTIVDYQAGPPAKISIDNQWDSRCDKLGDKAVTPEQLFKAMRPKK